MSNDQGHAERSAGSGQALGDWFDRKEFWRNKRAFVIGGAGFLGSYVVDKLCARGCREVFVPRSKEYDLTQLPAAQKLYADSRPDIVIHPATRVGGIPAEFSERCGMKISYDPAVDALYIRLVDEPVECEVIRLNDRGAINIGPSEQVVGIEILDASQVLSGLKERQVQLENLVAA